VDNAASEKNKEELKSEYKAQPCASHESKDGRVEALHFP
jgi:hypothetical protein